MPTDKRQVILIMTDTQRTDMLGCYGNPDMKTPALDRLASQGMRYQRAYSCQPLCGPARAALFTGLWPHTNGVWSNSTPRGMEFRTLGQRLTQGGIYSAYIGKWHLDSHDYFGLGKCPDGWDPRYWYEMRNYLDELSEADRLLSRQTQSNHNGVPTELTFGHRVSNRAIEFLDTHADQEFFLVVSYDEPHGPYLCPQPYADMYKDYDFPKRPNVWDTLEGKPEHQKAWAGDNVKLDRDALKIGFNDFLGCNSFVDSEIGRVLEAIDKVAPDALVIYTSDHGALMHSHSLTNKGAVMYDEITNIPLLVRWPGKTPAGSVCGHPATHIDIVPTVLDVFSLPKPKLLPGKSMLPSLGDPQVRLNDAVFMEFGRYEITHDAFGGFQPIRAIFDGRWKLAINLLSSDELYDLEEDPYEMTNLILSEEFAATRNALHDKLLNWMNETVDPFRGYYWERRPWRTDARPATWLYTGMMRRLPIEDDGPTLNDYDTGLPEGPRPAPL